MYFISLAILFAVVPTVLTTPVPLGGTLDTLITRKHATDVAEVRSADMTLKKGDYHDHTIFPRSKFTGDPRFSFQPSPSTSLGSQHCDCFKDGDDTPITLTDCAVSIGCEKCCNNAGYSDTKRSQTTLAPGGSSSPGMLAANPNHGQGGPAIASHLHEPPTRNQISSYSTLGDALILPPSKDPAPGVIPRPADQVPDEYGDDSINTFYLSDSLNHFEATHIGTSGRQGSTIPPHMPGSGSEYRIFTLGNHHAGHYQSKGKSYSVPATHRQGYRAQINPNVLNHVKATYEAEPSHSSPPPPAVQVPGSANLGALPSYTAFSVNDHPDTSLIPLPVLAKDIHKDMLDGKISNAKAFNEAGFHPLMLNSESKRNKRLY